MGDIVYHLVQVTSKRKTRLEEQGYLGMRIYAALPATDGSVDLANVLSWEQLFRVGIDIVKSHAIYLARTGFSFNPNVIPFEIPASYEIPSGDIQPHSGRIWVMTQIPGSDRKKFDEGVAKGFTRLNLDEILASKKSA